MFRQKRIRLFRSLSLRHLNMNTFIPPVLRVSPYGVNGAFEVPLQDGGVP
jgi:hypothetical protein